HVRSLILRFRWARRKRHIVRRRPPMRAAIKPHQYSMRARLWANGRGPHHRRRITGAASPDRSLTEAADPMPLPRQPRSTAGANIGPSNARNPGSALNGEYRRRGDRPGTGEGARNHPGPFERKSHLIAEAVRSHLRLPQLRRLVDAAPDRNIAF